MQSQDEVLLLASPAELVSGSSLETTSQRRRVDVEDEDTVDDVEESVMVPGPSAEEREAPVPLRGERTDLALTPEMLLVRGRSRDGRTGRRIALVGELGVAVERLDPTSAQLAAYRGLGGARDAFHEEVHAAHAARP
ncbi:hypothetical protein [Serinicoccus marinus]|uniref:hypothetical protein n=1 Tax=Serinicoccus marinus TaxID=247333 RepID=UPI00146BF5C7|nr:hypothetical protein [Serinicoccus marinus]